MNRTISIVVLIVGIALLVYGISATDSVSSDLSRFFTGSPTNKAIWLLISGLVISVLGASGLVRGTK
jgi:uncharacterized membrane protein